MRIAPKALLGRPQFLASSSSYARNSASTAPADDSILPTPEEAAAAAEAAEAAEKALSSKSLPTIDPPSESPIMESGDGGGGFEGNGGERGFVEGDTSSVGLSSAVAALSFSEVGEVESSPPAGDAASGVIDDDAQRSAGDMLQEDDGVLLEDVGSDVEEDSEEESEATLAAALAARMWPPVGSSPPLPFEVMLAALLPELPRGPLSTVPAFSCDGGDEGSGGVGARAGAGSRLRSAAMCVGLGASLKRLRALVSKKKRRFIAEGFDLDLTYVTRRIIAMGYPSVGGEGLYRNPLAQVQRFFETRHAGRYRIYNLCAEREYDPGDFCGRVVRFPFEDHNPCLLEVVPRFCADVHAWLAAHPANVVGIHCKAGKGRTGMLIAAYLLHSGFRRTAHSALAYFGAVRTKDGKGVTIPSQMRMVYYYEKMLKFGAPPVFTYALRWVRLRTIPNVDAGGGCTPTFILFCNGVKVFDYAEALAAMGALVGRPSLAPRRFRAGEPVADIDCTLFDLRLAGTLQIQVHQLPPAGAALSKRTHLAGAWFHTGFIARNYLYFGRHVLDRACKDKKGVFAPGFALELLIERVGGAAPPPPPLPPPPPPPTDEE